MCGPSVSSSLIFQGSSRDLGSGRRRGHRRTWCPVSTSDRSLPLSPRRCRPRWCRERWCPGSRGRHRRWYGAARRAVPSRPAPPAGPAGRHGPARRPPRRCSGRSYHPTPTSAARSLDRGWWASPSTGADQLGHGAVPDRPLQSLHSPVGVDGGGARPGRPAGEGPMVLLGGLRDPRHPHQATRPVPFGPRLAPFGQSLRYEQAALIPRLSHHLADRFGMHERSTNQAVSLAVGRLGSCRGTGRTVPQPCPEHPGDCRRHPVRDAGARGSGVSGPSPPHAARRPPGTALRARRRAPAQDQGAFIRLNMGKCLTLRVTRVASVSSADAAIR